MGPEYGSDFEGGEFVFIDAKADLIVQPGCVCARFLKIVIVLALTLAAVALLLLLLLLLRLLLRLLRLLRLLLLMLLLLVGT